LKTSSFFGEKVPDEVADKVGVKVSDEVGVFN